MDRLLSKKQVSQLISVGLTQIGRYVSEPEYAHLSFPKPVRIMGRVLWSEIELHGWIRDQLDRR